MPIKYAQTGRRTTHSDPVHLESIHPEVVVPVASNLDDTISGGKLLTAFGDSASIDAFARLRVSNPAGLFDGQLQYDLHRILWQDKVTNNSGSASATHQANESSADLTVGANDTIIRQTRSYMRYQPGKSQLVMVTFVLGAGVADVEQKVGYFDADNGIFLNYDGTTANIVRRTKTSGSVVDNSVAQADWNVDKMNGAGPSGINLDFTKSQILLIDMEWLGVGRVRIGFVVDGIPVYCHEFRNANSLDTVYMTTANLPVRYEISAAVGVTGTHTLQCVCAQVSSEGGFELARGLTFSATNGRTTRSIGTSEVPLVSIRPKSTFNSIVNRGLIVTEAVSIFSEDQPAYYKIVYGGTLTNASFNSVNDDSIVDYDVAATAISGGIEIMTDYVATGQSSRGSGAELRQLSSLMPMFLDIDGNHPASPYTDSLSLVAVSMVAQSTDMSGAIMWREVR